MPQVVKLDNLEGADRLTSLARKARGRRQAVHFRHLHDHQHQVVAQVAKAQDASETR